MYTLRHEDFCKNCRSSPHFKAPDDDEQRDIYRTVETYCGGCGRRMMINEYFDNPPPSGEKELTMAIDQHPATVDELVSLLTKSEKLFDGDYTPAMLRKAAGIHNWVIQNLSISVDSLLKNADKMEKLKKESLQHDNPPPGGEKGQKIKTFCPNCGFGASVDVYGCCLDCGADSVGDGVDMLFDLTEEHKTVSKAIKDNIPDNPPPVGPGKE